ncbi:hypothetical protein SAMN05216238_101332 [Lentibacillus persicus]|uniref:Outer membrane lipoprotein-sorting protein n=1 Tax=Lentibacillus persicus TaxID=640948 RepID=A0A1I1SB89_9BACI|nr:cell envelope integrity protein TolA [Lentibacillus persicus]SFD43687.1 hypothetical protein SAMN05216238_101332 [Lentibacillus persicus]
MKPFMSFIFILVMLFFVACGDDNMDAGSNEREASEQPAQTEATEDKKDAAEKEGTDHEEKQKSDKAKGTADKKENEETTDEPAAASGDAENILRNAAEAMAGLKSFKGTSDYIDETTMNGQTSHTEGTFTMEIVYGDSQKLYVQSSDVSSDAGEGAFEFYMTGDHFYVNSEEHWFSMPVDSEQSEMYEQFKVVEDDQFDQFSHYSNAFDVTDNGDHYVLTFAGDDAAYKDIAFGATVSVSSNMLEEHFDNMEISDGSYEITIDKNTGYITGYQMEYTSTTTSDLGDMEQYYKGTFELSNFNEIEDITVPDDVVEKAELIQ